MDQSKLLHLNDTIHNSLNPLHLRLSSLTAGGLISPEIRKHGWKIIMSCPNSSWRQADFSKNKDSHLIKCDVDRSLFGTDMTDSYSDKERDEKRGELSELINTVIKKNPDLFYVQGFNYISSIFLLTAGFSDSYWLSERCAFKYLREFMKKDFNEGAIQTLKLTYDILDIIDSEVSTKIKEVYTFGDELMVPDFILSWVICWFSGSLYKFNEICRVFDFCLATHPLAPIYLAVGVILSKRDQVLCVDDMSEIHGLFREIDGIDVDELCERTFGIMVKVSPVELAEKNKEKFKSDSVVVNSNEFEVILKRKRNEKRFSIILTVVIGLATAYILHNE